MEETMAQFLDNNEPEWKRGKNPSNHESRCWAIARHWDDGNYEDAAFSALRLEAQMLDDLGLASEMFERMPLLVATESLIHDVLEVLSTVDDREDLPRLVEGVIRYNFWLRKLSQRLA